MGHGSYGPSSGVPRGVSKGSNGVAGVLVPMLIACLCLIIGFLSGWFGRASRKLPCAADNDCQYSCISGACYPVLTEEVEIPAPVVSKPKSKPVTAVVADTSEAETTETAQTEQTGGSYEFAPLPIFN
jgi:hypothetical protein